MDQKQTLTAETAATDITIGCNQLVIRALINDLAAARVRIAELEAKLVPNEAKSAN